MKFIAVCCFCNKGIRKGKIDPLEVGIAARVLRREVCQTFWAHIKCFVKKLFDKTMLSEELGGPPFDFKNFVRINPPWLKKMRRPIRKGA